MSILIDENTKIICQGLTGKQATIHSLQSLSYGTKIVGGVTPGKGNTKHIGVPIFNTVKEAVYKTNATVSLIYVPATSCKDAILEAIDSQIKLIVCITEGVPILDMLIIKSILKEKRNCMMIGPNSPGIITPNKCRIGIMPESIYTSGYIGIISRSGTLTYEIVKQISEQGLGQSTCVGIGGDYITGTDFIDIIKLFEKDYQTKIIMIIGEIGGNYEEKAANYIKKNVKKPVFFYIAGITAPKNKKMGHAGAIAFSEKETVKEKYKFLKNSGVKIISNLLKIGSTLKNVII